MHIAITTGAALEMEKCRMFVNGSTRDISIVAFVRNLWRQSIVAYL